MNDTPFSDPNYGIDCEIAEVVRVYSEDSCEYMIYNNVTRQWANNGRKYSSAHAARDAARRIIETYTLGTLAFA
jgi:hypothetical protein